jgi:hypothetical protein
MEHVTIKLEPMQVTKPRAALDEAANVARRLGCNLTLALNGAVVTIGPMMTKSAVVDAWSAAAKVGSENA